MIAPPPSNPEKVSRKVALPVSDKAPSSPMMQRLYPGIAYILFDGCVDAIVHAPAGAVTTVLRAAASTRRCVCGQLETDREHPSRRGLEIAALRLADDHRSGVAAIKQIVDAGERVEL